MTLFSMMPFVAAAFSLVLAFATLLRKQRPLASWCFFAGMTLLAVDGVLAGLATRASALPDVLGWLRSGFIVKAFMPAAWLVFTLTYSRGNYRESLARWRIPLTVVAVLPVAVAVVFREQLLEPVPVEDAVELSFGPAGKALNVILLVAHVWILSNFEETFRAAIGTMRWRIKYVVLGLAAIFGARLYCRSQSLVFSVYDPHWPAIEAIGLLIGCGLLALAYWRTGLAEIDVYPSRAVLRSSITVLIAGGYLFVIGVLARIATILGGPESFELTAFIVLLGMTGLAVLLLSDRLRQRIHNFIGRHFTRAQHDSVRIWTGLSRRLANVEDQAGLCAASARFVSETFEVLSVTIWLADDRKDQLSAAASTAQPGEVTARGPREASGAAVAGLRLRSSPFDLEEVDEPWAGELLRLNPTTFSNGGHRWCAPLRSGEQIWGALVLTDRVNGADYTPEELHLLACIADQVTSVLLNLRLANEVAQARELEAFRTMSAFFVHDLKNTAASLNLMLKNLPVHFDDPAFREDAWRGIGNTARRIDEMIGRLTALRRRPDFKPVKTDLNQLVTEALDRVGEMPRVDLTTDLQPVPQVLADHEQMGSVVTNLVLNARDALGQEGRIRVRTEHLGGNVILSVADNGCGMSPEFLKDSLFRPFQSTKKKGLGIGMFQSRMIVEAHGGNIRVESEPGKGSTFRVSLPVKDMK